MKALRLRLPLPPRPEPVLEAEELRVIADLLDMHIDWATRRMEEGRVSEAIIRKRINAESARTKVGIALAERHA